MRTINYEDLDFTSDFLFCKILTKNPDICKELVELILDRKVEKIEFIAQQDTKGIRADKKGIRLDVYLGDSDNTVYDLEMQASRTDNLPNRTRYYQSIIDLSLLERGGNYNSLKKSFIIFICTEDPFGKGLCRYTFENTCREEPTLLLEDGAVKVFLNAKGTEGNVSADLKNFLKFLTTGKALDDLTERISREVKRSKDCEEWRTEYMTLQMRDWENQEIGRKEGQFVVLFNLIKSGLITEAQACEQTDGTKEEFLKWLSQQK